MLLNFFSVEWHISYWTVQNFMARVKNKTRKYGKKGSLDTVHISNHYYAFRDYTQKSIRTRVWWELKDTCNLCKIMNSAIRYSRYRVYLGREGSASKRRDVNEWIHVECVSECETRMDMYTLQAMSTECNHWLNTSFIRVRCLHVR